ncbi:MAG TPA: twin-arginine translocase TatA/TatE family subunit [Acidimicrobiia bacterium]|jgi:sec-independent protein translocase protein TatA|nr:twin-arginine translocase TatA/TatE family subunit [Acidimicrobiia bacterium]
MDVGPVELLIVLAVVLLLFGSKKLPELAKGMGQAAKEFRSGLHDEPEPEPKSDDAKAVESKAVEAPAVEAPAVEAPGVEAKPDPST